jgi:serine/threonine protein kinase
MNPSTKLEDLLLEGAWRVGPLEQKKPQSTGGHFSQSYRVLNEEDGRRAFLKALDFYSAFGDGPKSIELVATLFNFEEKLLEVCKSRGMDRVVRALSSGVVKVDPTTPFGTVPYLIFEEATSDIRVALGDRNLPTDTAWKLRALHHVTTGLKQLHGAGIAHQDLKPSNVLIFLIDQALFISKIADLGNAASANHPSPYDVMAWAGDYSYAPPEIHYSYLDPDWDRRRIGADLYLLGGLLSFIFSSTTSLATLFHFLPLEFHPGNWDGSYDEVLPYIRHAFTNASELFEASLPEKLAAELMPIYRQLCEPDPRRRGAPNTSLNRNALEKFVTRFDLLAAKAKAGRYDVAK